MNGKIFSFIVVGVIALVVLGFYFNKDASYNAEEFRKFDSYNELENYIRESSSLSDNYMFKAEGAGDSGAPSVSSAGAESFGGTGGSSDYSKTNIQVDGVDELDIVKNDGKYIYTTSGNKVIIVEAYPADSMKIVKEIEFDNYVNGMFVEDGRLVVLESSYGYYYGGYGGVEVRDGVMAQPAAVDAEKIAVDSIAPPSSTKSEVIIHVYNTDDFSEIENFAVDGNYYAARLIDGDLYVVSNKYIQSDSIEIPAFRAGDDVEAVTADRVYYPGYYNSNLLFTSVMAIDLEELEYRGDVFLIGGNSAIYVSKDAIYLTTTKTYDWQDMEEKRLDIMVKSLPDEIRSEAEEIMASDDEFYVRQDKIAQLLAGYFNGLSLDEKKQIEEDIASAYEDYSKEISKEYEKTIIHKIEIDGLDISYSGNGEVPGYILNQFSMDEFDGNFRIATTTGNIFWNSGSSLNHLYVLNDNLEIIGAVEDLAEGERIYSTRFVGDKAYMVTFRQVDPLYVIDLSNPSDPEVLGYLKVTGFSNYLHPIGDNLLLGIGREASEQGRSQGLKISLFDVSDFENPIEVDKYVVESDWSYSEAEYEHKAVLFDDEKDLLVIPVTYSQQLGDKWEYWQGAFAFGVTDSDVSLKAKIDHQLKDDKIDEYYGYGRAYVQRSLFIDSNLYTISNMMIKSNNINDFTETGKVDLPFDEPIYGPALY